jgi:EAL domain-containing protein (putative c-di-GMP-specific phosphodiesterase class I)
MPRMTGIELLRAIREHEPDLPVILVTGLPTVESATEAIEYGVFRYLEKPVKRRTLEATVEQASMLYRLAWMKREALALLGTRGGASDRAGLEVRFERALGALSIAFQPVVFVSDRLVLGYEALLRTSNMGFSGPPEVLDAAERLDAVFRVGRLIRGCAARLFEQAPAESILFLNLHPWDLTDPELLDEQAPLTQMADRVVLEITERASLAEIHDVKDHVAVLRARGYRIAVDDLGAGNAGLTSFALLEPEIVKIDASLARNVDTNRMNLPGIRRGALFAGSAAIPALSFFPDPAGGPALRVRRSGPEPGAQRTQASSSISARTGTTGRDLRSPLVACGRQRVRLCSRAG